MTKATKKMKEDSKIMVKAQQKSFATTAAPKLDITMRTMNGDCSQTAPSQMFNSSLSPVKAAALQANANYLLAQLIF